MGIIYRNGYFFGDSKDVIQVEELPEHGKVEKLYICDESVYWWDGVEWHQVSGGGSISGEKNSVIVGTGNNVTSSKLLSTIENWNELIRIEDSDTEIHFSILTYNDNYEESSAVTDIITTENAVPAIENGTVGEGYIIEPQDGCTITLISEKDRAIIFIASKVVYFEEMNKERVEVEINGEVKWRNRFTFNFETLKNTIGIAAQSDTLMLTNKHGGQIKVNDKSRMFLGGDNLTALDGDTRFTMHDSAEMDLTGGVDRPDAGPKIYMHGNATIISDDGWYRVGSENKPYFIVTSISEDYDEPQENITYDKDNYNFISYHYYNDKGEWVHSSTKSPDSDYPTATYLSDFNNFGRPTETSLKLTLSDIRSYYKEEEELEVITEKTKSEWDSVSYSYVTKYYYEIKRTFICNVSLTPSLKRMILEGNGNPKSAYSRWEYRHDKSPSITMMNSPSVYLDGFPEVCIEDSPFVKFNQDGEYTFSGDTHLRIQGHRKATFYDYNYDLWKAPTWVDSWYKNCANQLEVMGSNAIKFIGEKTANEVIIEGCQIHIGVNEDNVGKTQFCPPTIRIQESVELELGGNQIKVDSMYKRPDHLGSKDTRAKIKFAERANLLMTGYSALWMYDASTIRTKNFSFFEMADRSSIETSGSSRISLFDQRYNNAYGSPAIHGNPNQFMFGNFGVPVSNNPNKPESFSGDQKPYMENKLEPWEDKEAVIAEIRKEQQYRNVTATTEEDINKLNTMYSKYAYEVDEDYKYYSYIKTTNIYYITNEEHEAFMTWAQNQYGTGNYNYNRCNVIFTVRYVLKPERRNDFFDLTGETGTIYASYSTWTSWYQKIVANGEDIEDYFDILWQKYDYYYSSYGYYYDGYWYYNKPTPNKTFEYISSDSSNISAFTQIFKNHPEYLDCISYIEVDSKIYPYTVIDMDKFNELKNNFAKYTSDKLFSNTYDSEGRVISRRLSYNTAQVSEQYTRGELIKYSGYMFCMQGDTRVIIGSGNSSTYGDEQWTNSKGKVYIDIKPSKPEDNMKILMSGSTFMQATGNSHVEIHDDSTFVMRGITRTKADGTYVPAWLDGEKGWTRPVPTRENGPGVGYYDKSTFIMRGRWNTEATFAEKTSVFYCYNLEEFPTSVEDFTAEMQEAYNKELEKDKWYYVEGGTVTYVNTGVDRYTVTVTNATVTDRPHNWSEHPSKQEDSPLVEVIEDSILQMYGSSHIRMNDDEIIFGNAQGSVSFTIAELEALKTLLNT